MSQENLKKKSSMMTDGDARAPSRAILRGTGFTDADFEKPLVGVASCWAEVTTCNMHLDKLAVKAKKGAVEANFAAQFFNTITVFVKKLVRLVPVASVELQKNQMP